MCISNAGRKKPLSLMEIQFRLFDLKMRVMTEKEFGLPSYEDGSQSPRGFINKLLSELTELEESAYRLVMTEPYLSKPEPTDYVLNLDWVGLQPPATAESLSTPNSDSSDEMDSTPDSDLDSEGSWNQVPL